MEGNDINEIRIKQKVFRRLSRYFIVTPRISFVSLKNKRIFPIYKYIFSISTVLARTFFFRKHPNRYLFLRNVSISPLF